MNLHDSVDYSWKSKNEFALDIDSQKINCNLQIVKVTMCVKKLLSTDRYVDYVGTKLLSTDNRLFRVNSTIHVQLDKLV